MVILRFPERLRELREEKEWTQQELGAKLNLTNTTINRYENGYRQPDPETLNKLAEIFGVSTDYLLGRTDNRCFEKHISYKVDPLEGLTPEDRKSVEDFIDFMKVKAKKRKKK